MIFIQLIEISPECAEHIVTVLGTGNIGKRIPKLWPTGWKVDKGPACGLEADGQFSYSPDTVQCRTVMVLILTAAQVWDQMEPSRITVFGDQLSQKKTEWCFVLHRPDVFIKLKQRCTRCPIGRVWHCWWWCQRRSPCRLQVGIPPKYQKFLLLEVVVPWQWFKQLSELRKSGIYISRALHDYQDGSSTLRWGQLLACTEMLTLSVN